MINGHAARSRDRAGSRRFSGHFATRALPSSPLSALVFSASPGFRSTIYHVVAQITFAKVRDRLRTRSSLESRRESCTPLVLFYTLESSAWASHAYGRHLIFSGARREPPRTPRRTEEKPPSPQRPESFERKRDREKCFFFFSSAEIRLRRHSSRSAVCLRRLSERTFRFTRSEEFFGICFRNIRAFFSFDLRGKKSNLTPGGNYRSKCGERSPFRDFYRRLFRVRVRIIVWREINEFPAISLCFEKSFLPFIRQQCCTVVDGCLHPEGNST